MKTLQISEQKARELYMNGSLDVKSILEETFGKEFFSQKVTERIKTYEDACSELGIEPLDEAEFIEHGFTTHDVAYQKLATIIKALNEGWVPDVFYSNIYRWYPYFKPNGSPSSFSFRASTYDYSDAYASSGSRLCLKSEELSDYCGKQFLELWKEHIL